MLAEKEWLESNERDMDESTSLTWSIVYYPRLSRASEALKAQRVWLEADKSERNAEGEDEVRWNVCH